jgi:hypothetical protein
MVRALGSGTLIGATFAAALGLLHTLGAGGIPGLTTVLFGPGAAAAFLTHGDDVTEAQLWAWMIGLSAGLWAVVGALVAAGLRRVRSRRAAAGAGIGAAIGLVAGALVGLGVETGTLPAVGPAVTGGPVTRVLVCGAAGMVAGGGLGGIVGLLRLRP